MDTKLATCLAAVMMTVCSSYAEEAKTPPSANVKTFSSLRTSDLQADERKVWLVSMRAKLPMTHRSVGPFGLSQDLNKKAVVEKKKRPISKAFLNAIKVMKINFVNAADGRFAVGSREFKKGEIFPLERGNSKFMTKVVQVTSSYIVFKDVNNGEHVKKNLVVLPEGMTANGEMDSIEGVIPQVKGPGNSQPLKLD